MKLENGYENQNIRTFAQSNATEKYFLRFGGLSYLGLEMKMVFLN